VELVVFESDELSVEQCVLDVFVSKDFNDVQDVFGFGVFSCRFPVA
jgi:hypothetical protein